MRGAGQAGRTLHPGDVVCVDRGGRLETLLGSCVAIVLTDPRRTVGVMCHFVHAGLALSGAAQTSAHANVARDAMHALLRERGMTPTLCEAYVYGGANMFPGCVTQSHVGDDNARWALATLAADGIPVVFADLGGSVYRRLRWTVGPDMPHVSAVEA